MYVRSKSLGRIGVLASALLLSATFASGGNVGYYEISAGRGNPIQVTPITAVGETAVQLFTLSPAELARVDVLFALNLSLGAYKPEYVNALPDITAAVNFGMVLCFAGDRYVAGAASGIPGGVGISFFRSFSNGIDIIDNTTLVTIGSSGTITNTNLDGGAFSNHGFATTGTLPAGSTAILSNSVATQAVTFSYPQGSGAVVYSSVPLDFFLRRLGPNPPSNNFRNIYAPNMVEYCASLAVRKVEIDIDIKPGINPNGVNPRSKGVIPVAVLGSADFDAGQADPASVAFGPNGASVAHNGHVEDVNNDDFPDMTFHFRSRDTGIACGDTDATLTGAIFAGARFTGTDAVKTAGCK